MAKNIYLEEIVSQYHADLYRFAFALAKNESDAADLTQQTFLALAKHQKQIRKVGKVKTWLFTTLRREFLRNVREHTAHPQVEYRQKDHETAIESNALRFVDSRYWTHLRRSKRVIDLPCYYFTWATSHLRRFRMS